MKTTTARKPARLSLSPVAVPAPLPAGTRIRWDGDMANDPQEGTVKGLDGWHMIVLWDGADKTDRMPRALLDSPRWHVLAAAKVPTEAEMIEGAKIAAVQSDAVKIRAILDDVRNVQLSALSVEGRAALGDALAAMWRAEEAVSKQIKAIGA